MMRIGQGFDVHAFCDGDHVVLGGVKIPHEKGLMAHSDGDVLIHALMDAMLGALALGDIGKHFPDTDPAWQGCDSTIMLRHVRQLVEDEAYQLVNMDCTIICESPRLGPHIESMQSALAESLSCLPEQLSIKASTTEKLGFSGRKEGIAALVNVLLQKQ